MYIFEMKKRVSAGIASITVNALTAYISTTGDHTLEGESLRSWFHKSHTNPDRKPLLESIMVSDNAALVLQAALNLHVAKDGATIPETLKTELREWIDVVHKFIQSKQEKKQSFLQVFVNFPEIPE